MRLQFSRIGWLSGLAAVLPHLLWAQARMLAPDTLSNGGVFGLTLNAAGDEAYSVSSSKGREQLRIMTARRVAGRWQTPVVASFSGRYRDIDPILSPDGRRLFFNSDRPVQGDVAKKDFDVWVLDRDAAGSWSAPQRVGAPVSTDSVSEFYASPSREGTLYFTANRKDGRGRNDLYVARWQKTGYAAPENLAGLNTAASESNPYISPDGSILLFFSDRPGGAGDSDLYISYREKGQWSAPQNLGRAVNTAAGEFCPFVSADGKTLYFSRQVRQAGGIAAENLYYIRTQELPLNAKRWKRAFR
ncbi:TolB-like translocation protein [Hymenobacter weizhouensis]|uniref:hypothetical protein n=1 Tax=Hymenobacter sp. YIM 151500-1 TaxID=2987689 RepID=UPI00222673CB|nr:hypothetical protein [Hymenobacter sp. YIM 151500-1]UYZ61793.1 hypothetical protein OIS53_12350 [Hymenobacter sp. YIM 151500-1]